MADDNGRVTLAIIKRDLEYIKQEITEIKDDIKSGNVIHDNHERRIGRVEEKISNTTYIQLGFATIMSAIAAWLGIRQ